MEDATDVHAMLQMDVKREEGLVVGQLDNGFRYVILPNKLPPTRFEAHLEVGSSNPWEPSNRKIYTFDRRFEAHLEVVGSTVDRVLAYCSLPTGTLSLCGVVR